MLSIHLVTPVIGCKQNTVANKIWPRCSGKAIKTGAEPGDEPPFTNFSVKKSAEIQTLKIVIAYPNG